jgi:hypothetical protein
MGTEGNKRFYQIPYRRIVQHLYDKKKVAGELAVAGDSKCVTGQKRRLFVVDLATPA